MERGANGQIEDTFTSRAELEADFLALELLAPYRMVLASCAARGYDAMQKLMFAALTGRFGLPTSVAQRYATQLAGTFYRQQSVSERFKL